MTLGNWTFEPYVERQAALQPSYSYDGPILLGLRWVRRMNEKGLVIYVGPWCINWTWINWPGVDVAALRAMRAAWVA